MSVAYETSFTMRGATGVILQLYQILHLPRKMTVMIDPRDIWNVIYNARSTKYCACHAKCISWLIRVTYETSFRMRGASKVNLEPHQILRLPRKMNLMIDPRHKWNVIYNARSKHSQPPTSPNTAPATKSVSSRFQRKLRELLPPIERRFEDNPRIKSSSRTRRFGDLTRPILETHFVWKNTTFRSPAISQNCTKCCTCHEKSHSNFTKYCACHAKWISSLIRVTYGIYSLLASILSRHLRSPGIYSLQASILSRHLFSLGICSLLASILSWHLLSRHLFSLGIYSLLASILSWHLFSLGIYSL